MSKAPANRMIETTAVLMRERGVEATSFSDVLVASGAPRGSIYHYFPRGKAQLIEEATRYGVQFVVERITAAFENADTATAIGTFGGFYVQLLRDSDFGEGCPVVPAALEGDRNPSVRDLAGEGFRQWEQLFAAGLQRDGLAADQAASLATLVISSLEGSLVLARAQRTTAPFERVLEQLQAVVRDTVERARSESVRRD